VRRRVRPTKPIDAKSWFCVWDTKLLCWSNDIPLGFARCFDRVGVMDRQKDGMFEKSGLIGGFEVLPFYIFVHIRITSGNLGVHFSHPLFLRLAEHGLTKR